MENNKKNFVVAVVAIAILFAAVAIRLFDDATAIKQGSGAATTGKPAEVVLWSNGFPSGGHYNLNIHGKQSSFVCDPTPGGGSVFVNEYGQSEIQYIQNRRSSLSSLYVIDPCSFSPSDPAKVQLPAGEYQVYARILGKPGKEKTEETRSVVFYPKLIDACNDNATAPISGFGDFVDCTDESLIGLGLISSSGVFDKDSATLTRIAPVKGSNKAQEITDMFQWSGYVCSETYDINGDGEISLSDVSSDMDGDGDIDNDDLTFFLELNCQWFSSEWIFNIADLVIYGWDYNNMGSKLLQVRFYPLKTTTFEE